MGDPLEVMWANMQAFYRLLGARAPGGSVLERGGVVAAVVPSCPDLSVVNSVVYADAEALRAARDELEVAYARAGVRAWRVWVPERDRAVAQWLEEAGHRLTFAPRAMTMELASAEPGDAGTVEWERSSDDAALAALNERAHGVPDNAFAPALDGFSGPPAAIYLAYEDGEPAAGLATVDADGDCGVYCVATRPASYRRGLATALMRSALADARERGCETSSLQSTKAGFPVYERLGYRERGAVEVWERRPESG